MVRVRAVSVQKGADNYFMKFHDAFVKQGAAGQDGAPPAAALDTSSVL